MAKLRGTLAGRFWVKVDKRGPDDCWNWKGSKRGGWGDYGGIRADRHGPQLKAHRVSWELHNGPIPDALWVLHRCDNPKCVNPDHLFLGDHDANMADRKAKGRAGGVMNGRAKLSDDDVRNIRTAYAAGGVTQCDLARRYGMTQGPVGQIIRRERWPHVV